MLGSSYSGHISSLGNLAIAEAQIPCLEQGSATKGHRLSNRHLFISYSHKDEAYVRELARHLEAAGFQPWYFTESQPAGTSWAQQLLDAIVQARAVLVVISRASNAPEAEYVFAEVMLAQRERKQIIPLRIEPCTGPLDVLLASRNWLSALDGVDPIPRIVASLAYHPGGGSVAPADDYAQLIVHPGLREHFNRATIALEPPAATLLVPPVTTVLCRIGRDPRNDLVVSGALVHVSRQHVQVQVRIDAAGTAFLLIDERSRHGTFVNGVRLAEPVVLRDGDEIGLGAPRCLLLFSRLEATGDPPEDCDTSPSA
jgi:hypothetical protein